MKIIVSGKGGAGKSTVSAALAKEFASRGKQVMVVDNDESNYGLHSLLGLDFPEELMENFGGREEVFDEIEDLPEDISLADLPEEYIVEEDGLTLLAIGKIGEYGEGCACPMNFLSGEFLQKLSLEDDEVLIVDMDAGVEHFGREVEEGIDSILVVVDPTRESIKLSQRITDFAEEIDKPVYYILNKIEGEAEEIVTEELEEDRVIGVIPRLDGFYKAGLEGSPLNFEVGEVKELVDSFMEESPFF